MLCGLAVDILANIGIAKGHSFWDYLYKSYSIVSIGEGQTEFGVGDKKIGISLE